MSGSSQGELRSRKPQTKKTSDESSSGPTPAKDSKITKDDVSTKTNLDEDKNEAVSREQEQQFKANEVVFDEVHFGKFASYYLRREYYFDVHPPLAKMLIALGGWLFGYKGHFLFETIGLKYLEHGVPYILLRGWVCLFGCAVPPMAYVIMTESGYSCFFSLIAALFVVFDNSLVVHSRLILLDNMLIFFGMASVLCYVKFFKYRHMEFSGPWKRWLCLTGVMLGCVLSCKMVGLFTFMMIGSAVVFDLWRILDIRRGRTIGEVAHHFMVRLGALIVLPLMVYLSTFYIHFAILTKSGPGDAYHTADFQMQLEGNMLGAETPALSYGDGISFFHKGTGVFLTSRPEHYPLRYHDSRVSSQGQQVVGTKEFDETNSIWVIHPSKDIEAYNEFVEKKRRNETITTEEADKWKVHNMDEIRLLHLGTTTYLRTHDVASPWTPTNMEFTTAGFNDTKSFNDTIWELRVDGEKSEKKLIYAWSSFLRIVSKKHQVSAFTHKKPLPEWGHGDQEINGNKKITAKDTIWSVQHIAGKNLTEEATKKKRDIRRLWFIEKFSELQYLMLKHNSMLTKTHPYQSSPWSWPIMHRGVSYWTKKTARSQIYMMANPFGWWLSSFSVLLLGSFSFGIAFAKRRGQCQVDPIVIRHMSRSALFIVSGWFFHYFPFFFMGRSLFLHHYLPAVVFAYMTIGVVLQCLFISDYRRYAIMNWNSPARVFLAPVSGIAVSLILIALQIATFIYFSPMTYGTTSLEANQVVARKWLPSWDFQYAIS
ncbi:Dolichyl-phosphate-mannose--protein mannosyltransferase 4 [Mycoemilia scoparia]|uniref:Dolichyl-phosphate-mannose--protein mannosyltransferase n=1 Tax=Mycoemilia scoparia TaxID=417184 RepID=A0A9W8A2M9_9FUNG|nr:Dolichyl-phosphate-mannose--protein mannosyltransferase 4 [Mycoemilia scoparia]